MKVYENVQPSVLDRSVQGEHLYENVPGASAEQKEVHPSTTAMSTLPNEHVYENTPETSSEQKVDSGRRNIISSSSNGYDTVSTRSESAIVQSSSSEVNSSKQSDIPITVVEFFKDSSNHSSNNANHPDSKANKSRNANNSSCGNVTLSPKKKAVSYDDVVKEIAMAASVKRSSRQRKAQSCNTLDSSREINSPGKSIEANGQRKADVESPSKGTRMKASEKKRKCDNLEANSKICVNNSRNVVTSMYGAQHSGSYESVISARGFKTPGSTDLVFPKTPSGPSPQTVMSPVHMVGTPQSPPVGASPRTPK